jgi:hypothetical protein
MARRRVAGIVAVTAAASVAGIAVSAWTSTSDAAHLRHRRPTTTRMPTTTAPATAGPTAPTNLRVTGLTSTSVTFQWDHSQGTTGGCTIPIAIYYVYMNGVLRGSTYLGSPVAFAAGLQPGGTYSFTVQGRDNCSGRMSSFSEPLVVTTPITT